MKVIVPTNNKGGVGKTKVSILLAEYFSQVMNKRVVAIDLDSQCNFSKRFVKMELDPSTPEGSMPPFHPDYDPNNDEDNWSGRSSIAGIFYGDEVVPYPTAIANLEILPGHSDRLLQAEAVRRSEVVEKVHNQLNLFLSSEDVTSAYDIAIVDTAPSKGPLTVAAVKAATHILIPCIMEPQPIEGIYGMMQLWMQESLRRDSKRPLELVGILPNLFRQINLHKELLEGLKSNKEIAQYVMPLELGQRAAFAEVDTEQADPRTIFDLPDSNLAKKEALTMCEYVARRVFSHE